MRQTEAMIPPVQRIFSTFPRAAPGLALLLLRACVSGQLLVGLGARGSGPSWCLAGTLAVASLLCVGLATPVLALVSALLHTAGYVLVAGTAGPSAAFAVLDAAALALLGPGAYSIDARLFGPRIIVVTPGRHLDGPGP